MTGSLFDAAETPGGLVPLLPRGLARQAARAPELDQRNEVEYREIPCKSLLAPVRSERVPFEWSINPYRGCEIGCVYCYARYTHEYLELEEWLDFERRIFVKRGAPEALLNDLRRLNLAGKAIAIGTATDPYQPAERRHRVTRSLLELFATRRNLRLSLTTKSDLVRRDLDLLREIARGNELHVNVTVTTPRYELSRLLEPRAPRPDRRLGAVAALAAAGIRTGVFAMPILPRITDRQEDLDELARLAREAGAAYLAGQVLFLRASSRRRFLPFIQERFPELLPYYRRLYGPTGGAELAACTERTLAMLRSLRERHGFAPGAAPPGEAAGHRGDQLAFEGW
jgi:DNA repair photolyase